jgi:hypothetical protein
MRASANFVQAPRAGDSAVNPPGDYYMTLRDLATYSGMSVRTLQRYCTSLHRPIPHFRPGGPRGKIWVRRSDFDRWLAQWHYPDARALVNAKLARAREGA